MSKFIVSVAWETPQGSGEEFLVTAGTSGKAVNIVLARLDAVTSERLLHTIHCSVPFKDDTNLITGEYSLTVIPPEDVLPRHIVRG